MSTIAPPDSVTHAQATGAALSHLFDDHGRMVLGICRVYLGDPYEAEDAAQETFMSAHRSLLSGCQPEQSGPWLAAIARNECRDRIRGAARQSTSVAPQEMFERLPDAGSEDIAERIDRGTSLQAALDDLPESQREAFVLRELLGLRYDEIACALQTTDSAVESLLVRARRALKTHLSTKRLAPTALVVPFALRESLAHAVAGFPSSTAAAGGAAGAAGGSSALGSGSGTSGATPAAGANVSGAATSGSVGTSAGAGGTATATAATTTSATTVAASTAAGSAAVASSGALAGGIAIAGVTKVLATPILAKLAIAGATATVALTTAVSKPWEAEPQAPLVPVAGAVSPGESGVAGVKTELLVGDGGSAGAGIGVSDGAEAASVNPAADAPRPKTKRRKNDGNVAKAAKRRSADAPAASAGPADTKPSSTTPPATDPGGAPAQDPAPPARDDTSTNDVVPGGSTEETPAEPAEADDSPAAGDVAKKDATPDSSGGDAESPNGDSDSDSDEADQPVEATATDADGTAGQPIATSGDPKKKAKKNHGNGKKRGHEADGPGSSNDAPGHEKKSG